jgi:hypothetical protein
MHPGKFNMIGWDRLAFFLFLFIIMPGTIYGGERYKGINLKVFSFLDIKGKDTLRTDDTLNYDDTNDDDMYTPYDKWRIDLFDNWGKHNKKISSAPKPVSGGTDTVNSNKRKGLSDQDKESMLFDPVKGINGDNEKYYFKSPMFQWYNKLYLFSNSFFSNKS